MRIEIANVLLVGDDGDEAFAPLVGGPRREDLDTLGRSRQRPIILADIGDMGQALGRSDVVTEDVFSGRDAGDLGVERRPSASAAPS